MVVLYLVLDVIPVTRCDFGIILKAHAKSPILGFIHFLSLICRKSKHPKKWSFWEVGLSVYKYLNYYIFFVQKKYNNFCCEKKLNDMKAKKFAKTL